ncbi:uncharacterized protein UHOD_11382 [Ustilago sp. UG-2017b]|nr:uncharacterized protein UHOD_11382 [Ustilago sp. UG-2017b]
MSPTQGERDRAQGDLSRSDAVSRDAVSNAISVSVNLKLEGHERKYENKFVSDCQLDCVPNNDFEPLLCAYPEILSEFAYLSQHLHGLFEIDQHMLVNVMRWRDTTLACFRMRVFRGRCVLIVSGIRLGERDVFAAPLPDSCRGFPRIANLESVTRSKQSIHKMPFSNREKDDGAAQADWRLLANIDRWCPNKDQAPNVGRNVFQSSP